MASSLDIAALVRAELPNVLRLARRLRVPPSHVEDIAQEAFLLVHRRDRDRGVPPAEAGTLLRAATYWAASDLRKKLRYRAHPSLDQGDFDPPDRHPDAEQSASDAEQVERAFAIVDSLPDDLRDVFVLHEIEEMTLEEIAALTGVSPKTIAGRLYRAREAYKKAEHRRAAEERRKYQIAGALFLPLSDELLRAMRADPVSALPGAEGRVLAGVQGAIDAMPNVPGWLPRPVAELLRAVPPKALTFAAGVAVGVAVSAVRCGAPTPALAELPATPAPPAAVTVAASASPPAIAPTATASASVAASSATASASAPRSSSPAADADADTRCYQRALAFLSGNPRETLRLLTLCDQQYPTTLRPQRARLRRDAEALAQQGGR